MGLIYSKDDARNHLVPHLANRFVLQENPPSLFPFLLGSRGSARLGKWRGAGESIQTAPPALAQQGDSVRAITVNRYQNW